MSKEVLIAQVEVIANLLHDKKGFWFYYKAVKVLGFNKCYELCVNFEDKPSVRNRASYFNGCVMREVRERGLLW